MRRQLWPFPWASSLPATSGSTATTVTYLPRLAFWPMRWASALPAVSGITSSVTTVSVSTDLWTKLTSNLIPTWGAPQPISAETRLNRLYPQRPAEGEVPFIWRIQTQFPWYVASGSEVWIRSSITEEID